LIISDADPTNYMSFYKRATVFMALSRSRPALTDLDRVIELKPDFIQARVQRGSILTKMGRLDEAHIELERVLARDPKNEEATKLYVQIEPLQKSIQEIRDFVANKNFQPALDRLTEVIEVRVYHDRI
jgi:DnaJ family protein C protein 3